MRARKGGYPCGVIVHLNGELQPRDAARISPFDRGFLFGDAIYEGLRSITIPAGTNANGFAHRSGARCVGLDLHIARLRSGLAEARIACGDWDPNSLGRLTDDLLHANSMRDAFVYWQFSRGTPSGDEPLRQRIPPAAGLRNGLTVFGFCTPQPQLGELQKVGPASKRCALIADPRWSMGHMKSSSLMGNVISAIESDARGGDDAILVRDGYVVEGLATNVIVVTHNDELVTPNLSSAPMLAGITRAILLKETRGEMHARPIKVDELFTAREIMLTGSNTMVASVTSLVDSTRGSSHPVGSGTPGPVSRRLFNLLLQSILEGRDEAVAESLIAGCAWKGFSANGCDVAIPARTSLQSQ